MKIVIQGTGIKTMTIPVPNFLVTSPTLYRFGLSLGRHYTGEAVPNIPPKSLKAMAKTLKAVKKKHGVWELLHVESATGEKVTITL